MIRFSAVAFTLVFLAGSVRADDAQIGHMVYFQLKDSSPEARQKLVDACKKYLKEHDGVTFFAAGTIANDLKGDLYDRDWDVALHLVFKNKAGLDKYIDSKTHKQFVEENKDSWKKVRVFDSEIK
jgi:Stress responsive A/B Barrel Domain